MVEHIYHERNDKQLAVGICLLLVFGFFKIVDDQGQFLAEMFLFLVGVLLIGVYFTGRRLRKIVGKVYELKPMPIQPNYDDWIKNKNSWKETEGGQENDNRETEEKNKHRVERYRDKEGTVDRTVRYKERRDRQDI